MDVAPDIKRQLQAAIEPSETEIVGAKQTALDIVASGRPLSYDVLLNELCQQHGVAPSGGNRDVLDVAGRAHGASKAFDTSDAQLVRARVHITVAEAMGDLMNAGLLVRMKPADGAQGDVSISVTDRGHSGGVYLARPRPSIGTETFRLARGVYAPAGDGFRFLDPQLYLEGINDMVGSRGGRCIREAITAFRRNLYLSAANMLGAASEAAWYTLADTLVTLVNHNALRKAVDGDRTSEVVRLSVEMLRERKANIGALTELQAHEAYLRNLRNYGLHPRSDVNDDHEAAFTEAGCGFLLMQTRRYFVRLGEQAAKAGVRSGEE